jgi:copper transport protein
MRRGLVVAATVVVGVLTLVAPADARVVHAELLSTRPANGEVLDTAPDQVLLTFNEPVETDGDSIEVFDRSGDEVDVGDLTRPDGGRGVARALPALDDGAYVVGWHVVSTDSHPIRGAFVFRMGAPADAAAADADAQALMDELVAGQGAGRLVGTLYGVVRFAAFVGMVLLVGGAAFVLLVWPEGVAIRRLRRLVVAGWATTLAATLLSFGFQAAYTTGGGLADVVDPSAVADVLGTRAGAVWLVRLGLLALVALFTLWLLVDRMPVPRTDEAAALPGASDPSGPAAPADAGVTGGRADASDENPERAGTPAAPLLQAVQSVPSAVWVVLGVALLATISLAGHAGTGDLVPLALVVDVAHLAAVAFWLAGLTLLLVVVLPASHRKGDGRDGAMEEVVFRFSMLAGWAVVVIVATGTIQAWRQIGTVEALTDTTYGRLVIVKVLLVGAVLAAAALSRQWVRRAVVAPSPSSALSPGPGAVAAGAGAGAGAVTTEARPAVSTLRRSVLVEAAGAAVVLAVTALLVNTVPAEDDVDPTFTTEAHGSTLMVTVEVAPARAGAADITVETRSHAGDLVDPDEVTASLSLPERDLGPIDLTLERTGPGRYVATDAEIPYPGTWQLEIDARTGQFDQETIPVEVPVR